MAIRVRRDVVEGPSVDPATTIPDLARLLRQLDDEGIRYCSWKSNEHLAEALAGRTDVDLLVDASDLSRFRTILLRHGVKPLLPPPRAAFPGMEHHLGMDRASGRQYHLHVHDRLVLGERYVKNYRIPIEDEFLSSTGVLLGVPVPRPELELGILSARALLKYRPRDVVKDVLGIRTPGLQPEIQDEIHWLMAQTSIDQVGETFRTGAVPSEVVRGFLEVYRQDPRSGLAFLRLRTRLRSSLRARQRQSRLRATIAYSGTAWMRRKAFRRRAPDLRMKPATGGRTIALIGADGSGKSTIAAELTDWLGWKLQVRAYYMGSKEPSIASRWSYTAFRACRRGSRGVARRLGPSFAAPLSASRDILLALHHLSIARDRRRRHRMAGRDVRSGRIVVFDRYPLEAVGNDRQHRLLDGPQIASALEGSMGRLTRALARIEERGYRAFGLPDHLVVLNVDPVIAVDRKPDHLPELLAAKSQAVIELARFAELRHPEVDVINVDASRPLEEVLTEVRSKVWDVF